MIKHIKAVHVHGGYCYSSDTYDMSVNISHISTSAPILVQDYDNFDTKNGKRGFIFKKDVEIRVVNYTQLFKHTMKGGDVFYYTENLLADSLAND